MQNELFGERTDARIRDRTCAVKSIVVRLSIFAILLMSLQAKNTSHLARTNPGKNAQLPTNMFLLLNGLHHVSLSVRY